MSEAGLRRQLEKADSVWYKMEDIQRVRADVLRCMLCNIKYDIYIIMYNNYTFTYHIIEEMLLIIEKG